jgi:hypothetical protein
MLGHQDWHSRPAVGNEDLNELRIGIRRGHDLWIEVVAIAGLVDFSPDSGLLVAVGMRR